MEWFNLKKLNEIWGKEKYRIEVSNRFAALEDLDAEVEINSVLETIKKNKRISGGARGRVLVRHYATYRKVAGSIPDEVKF
jgi:hypothetical protein